MNEVMSIPQLSKSTGVSEFTLRKLCRDGKLPFLPIANRWLVRVEDFNNLFQTKNECSCELVAPGHSSPSNDNQIIAVKGTNNDRI